MIRDKVVIHPLGFWLDAFFVGLVAGVVGTHFF